MRKTLIAAALALLAIACNKNDPYTITDVTVKLSFPSEYSSQKVEGVIITASDTKGFAEYTEVTSSDGSALFKLQEGVYRFSAGTVMVGDTCLNACRSRISVAGAPVSVDLKYVIGRKSDICFKEIYNGGCLKTPLEGDYKSDSYVILHNNASEVKYLDGLCFGCADPYNSQASTVWPEDNSFVPVIQAVWKFPGKGTEFPLNLGEDAVLVVYGAIDHSATYPESVDLSSSDYFVCYNTANFWNTSYHPLPARFPTDSLAPRDTSRVMNLVVKLGRANAYTFSTTSPAAIIFRPEGTTIEDFVASSANVIQKPGSSDDRIVKLPPEWVVDGVEVFAGQEKVKNKRLPASVDGGFVSLSASSAGKSLIRYKNAAASLSAGYEVLWDTNNSSNDMYELKRQFLHKLSDRNSLPSAK